MRFAHMNNCYIRTGLQRKMYSPMERKEERNSMKALGYSVLIYAAIIGVCLLVGFSVPPPLPNQDMGMEINLGTSSQGQGTVQPLNPNPVSVQPSQVNTRQASPASNQTGSRTEDVLTQNTQDAPVIRKLSHRNNAPAFSKNIRENRHKVNSRPRPDAPVEPKPAPRRPKALYSGGTSHSNSSGNNAGASNTSAQEGLSGQNGDQGAVNGNPTAANHNGTYSGLGGNSLSYRLSGREIIAYPSREGQFNEPGRVRMSIKVDQQGQIVGYSVLSADNATLARLAERKVQQIRFNPSSDAPVIQFGEIVFVFKLQQ